MNSNVFIPPLATRPFLKVLTRSIGGRFCDNLLTEFLSAGPGVVRRPGSSKSSRKQRCCGAEFQLPIRNEKFCELDLFTRRDGLKIEPEIIGYWPWGS